MNLTKIEEPITGYLTTREQKPGTLHADESGLKVTLPKPARYQNLSERHQEAIDCTLAAYLLQAVYQYALAQLKVRKSPVLRDAFFEVAMAEAGTKVGALYTSPVAVQFCLTWPEFNQLRSAVEAAAIKNA